MKHSLSFCCMMFLAVGLTHCSDGTTNPDADTGFSDSATATTADTASTDTVAADSATADTPADTTPADTTPADTATTDSATADTATADTATADSNTTDSDTADSDTGDTVTADSATADTTTADSGTADSDTADSDTVDSATADSDTTDTDTADSNTTDSDTTDSATADSASDSASQSTAGALYTAGNRIMRDDGDGNRANDSEIILHGVSLIDIVTVSTDGGYKAQLDRAATWNVNVVRMPVYPHNAMHGDTAPIRGWSQATADDLFATYLDPAVQYAKSLGMYVIVDWHYIADVNSGDTNYQTTLDFWTDMAPRYADDPMVLYEVFNEPINTGGTWDDWNAWKSIAQDFVDRIRQYAPDNLVLVGGPKWSQRIGGCDDNPVSGGNIVYVAHLYDFHYYDNTGIEIEGAITDCKDTYPVMLTEWGYTDAAKGQPIGDFIVAHGLSFTGWAFHNAWGPPLFTGGQDDAPSTWNETSWGTYLRTFLNQF